MCIFWTLKSESGLGWPETYGFDARCSSEEKIGVEGYLYLEHFLCIQTAYFSPKENINKYIIHKSV